MCRQNDYKQSTCINLSTHGWGQDLAIDCKLLVKVRRHVRCCFRTRIYFIFFGINDLSGHFVG